MKRFFHPSFVRSCGLLEAVCLGGVLLAGCSSTPTTYYVLAPQTGPVASPVIQAALPQAIEVLTPSITSRLDRDGLLRVMQDAQDHMVPAAAWSEPLGEMLGHALAANLRQRLPGHVLFSQNDSVAVTAGAYLELSLSRFEQDVFGHAVITGVLSAHRAGAPDSQARAVNVQWVSPQPVGTKPADMVRVLAGGVGVLSDQAIQLLYSLPTLPIHEEASSL